ncbi:MAG: rhomboid family intramembrane serine protease [Chitinophagales bacterium]|nr:rhomboid family intramembrane serine protease [Chitinophagales bacterium]
MEIIRREKDEEEKKQLRVSIFIPFMFVCLLWLIFIFEFVSGSDFGFYGVFPRTAEGLRGIIFSPLIHGSFSHLFSNSIPLLVLGGLLFYFYRTISYKVFFLIWFIDGLGVWLFGREAHHIGASGLVYGMASFLFFSGILRKNRKLLAIALAVVFVYGGLLWGMLPVVESISWEAHLSGFLAGIFFSLYYLRKGPLDDPLPEWMIEENDSEELEKNEPSENEPMVKYFIKKSNEKEDDSSK